MAYIAVVDYGAGNLMSVQNSLSFLGIESKVADSPEMIEKAGAVILPGVGAFPDAMDALEKSGLLQAVKTAAEEKPFLGICLGMQMLFESSNEVRQRNGLGILKGEIKKIETTLKLPQIGWNALRILNPCPLTEGLSEGEYVYFVHGYMAYPEERADLCSVTDYGVSVPAIVARGNVFGCQFHPEKSGETGLHILQNFAALMEAEK